MKDVKKRILVLKRILKRKSDEHHKLTLNKINELLALEGIEMVNRKTLYDDFKILNDEGYIVEYSKGYYLKEAPFTISEIKIIIDSLNSLKNLDENFLNKTKSKLYSFISEYEEELLKNLEYQNDSHKNAKLINRLEDALNALLSDKNLIIKRKNKKEEKIVPLFLYRENDFYYLYYRYLNSNKIYHTRFDNITYINELKETDNIEISIKDVLKNINESTNAYRNDNVELVNFKIINDSEYLRSRIENEFRKVILTKDGFSLKTSLNDAFFAKLTTFKNDIKISDEDIANKYKAFLEEIIHNN